MDEDDFDLGLLLTCLATSMPLALALLLLLLPSPLRLAALLLLASAWSCVRLIEGRVRREGEKRCSVSV